MTFPEIIERLERAAGPSMDIDYDIWLALAQPMPVDPDDFPPRYTASLDAALTLVPKGYLWQVKQGIESQAIVWSLEIDYDDDGAPAGYSTTFPAIALCIAALKARAAMQPATRTATA